MNVLRTTLSNICAKSARNVLLSRIRSTTTASRSASVATPAAAQWDVIGAICLERKPLIAPPLTPIEQQMSDTIARLDYITSLKSNHELRQDEEKRRAEQLKAADLEETDPDLASRQTSQDLEDSWNEEAAQFKPAPLRTAADESGDLKTTDRLLDRHLVLVLRKKGLDGRDVWTLPQTQWRIGENLRQTAERALADDFRGVRARFLGNAPWGVHTVKYPQSARRTGTTAAVGAKIFFFKAQLVNTDAAPVVEHSWLGRNELDVYLEPSYCRSLRQFLIDED